MVRYNERKGIARLDGACGFSAIGLNRNKGIQHGT